MPAITNTLITDVMTAIFEDLDGVIRDISPTQTPIYSNGQKGTATNAAAHEWLTDTLREVRNTPQVEGNDTTFDALTQPTRLVNVCQIADDEGIVSGTANAVDAAPSSQREIVRQTIKKGKEVKRDVEAIIACNSVRSNTDPRNLSGLVTYMTNISIGATGVAPTGDGSDALTEGTARAFTIELVDTAMQQAFEAGGEPSMLVMDPQAKTKFSKLNFAGGGTDVAALEASRTQVAPVGSVGAVSRYISDFGDLDVVPDRFITPARLTGITNQIVFILDSSMYGTDTLPGRSFMSEPLAKTGDADKFLTLWEGTLKVHNQGAHACIADLDTTL